MRLGWIQLSVSSESSPQQWSAALLDPENPALDVRHFPAPEEKAPEQRIPSACRHYQPGASILQRNRRRADRRYDSHVQGMGSKETDRLLQRPNTLDGPTVEGLEVHAGCM